MNAAPFLDDDFLLDTAQARRLYQSMPRRCRSSTITAICRRSRSRATTSSGTSEIWLAGDHYKWRAMRADGVPERYCTATPAMEKFAKWPRPCRICCATRSITGRTSSCAAPSDPRPVARARHGRGVWEECNAKLARPSSGAGSDGADERRAGLHDGRPGDSLEHHRAIAADPSFRVKVLPTWRPTGACGRAPGGVQRLDRPARRGGGVDIGSYATSGALRARHDFFHARAAGLRHGRRRCTPPRRPPRSGADLRANPRGAALDAARSRRSGRPCCTSWRAGLGEGWTSSSTSARCATPARGCSQSSGRTRVRLDRRPALPGPWRPSSTARPSGQLTRTILYNLNPRTMPGRHHTGQLPGRKRPASCRWAGVVVLDQLDGCAPRSRSCRKWGF